VKILIISAAYPPMHAGEASNTYFLAKRLVDRKIEAHVLTSEGNTGGADSGITVHPIMRNWSWREMLRMRAFLRRCSPDAVLLMYLGKMYGHHPMITFAATISKRVLPQVPFVTRFENVFGEADPAKFSWFSRVVRRTVIQWAGPSNVSYSEGTILRDSDRLIFLCERHRDQLTKNWPVVHLKGRIIPPPPNVSLCSVSPTTARQRGRQKLGLSSESFVIAFLGYIYPGKGVDTLLRAFERVCRRRSGVRLLFIGGRNDLDVAVDVAYLDKVEGLSRQLQIDDKITWTGAFNPKSEEASMYLYAADVCALPFEDGAQMNNSSLGSVAVHGIPIITTKGRRIEAPFRDHENVLLCPPNDPDALAGAIDSLITTPELRERLSRGAIKLAEEWFSWESALDRTVQSLQRN
jgi:glycosyltransferase involved in cell wall biosynthesis